VNASISGLDQRGQSTVIFVLFEAIDTLFLNTANARCA
jgi:hypothetical protein